MPLGVLAPILTGVSAVAGAFGNKQKQTTTPTYSPDQTALQHQVAVTLGDRLNHPTEYLDTLKNSAIGGVNDSFGGIEARMKRTLTGQGYGRSGKLGLNTQALEIARQGQLSDLESKFAGLQLDQDNHLLDDATRFGFAGAGSSSTGTAGGGVGGAIGAGAETATLLYMLNHILAGGRVGGGVGGGVYGDEGYIGE